MNPTSPTAAASDAPVCDDGTGRSDCAGGYAADQKFASQIDPKNLNGTARQPDKTAAQLQTERLVAQSPLTQGQTLQKAWREGSVPHPATKLGLGTK